MYHIDQLPGGRADDADPEDFDEEALIDGTLHEMEHTDDESIAIEIAMDHLMEDPEYYRKLETIEKATSHTKESLRKKNSTPAARASRRKYMASKKGAKAHHKAQYSYRSAHPERYAAQQKARTDGAAGKGHKCARCGKPAVHKHHTSYESHDKYVWLCHAHHVKAHHPKSDLTKKSLSKSFGAEPFGPLVIDASVQAGTVSGTISTLLGAGREGPLPATIEDVVSADDQRTENDRQRSGDAMSNERMGIYEAIRAFDSDSVVKSMVSNESAQDCMSIGLSAAGELGVNAVPGSSAAPAGDGRFDKESKSGVPGAADAGAATVALSDDDRLPEQQMADGAEGSLEQIAPSAPAPDLQSEVDKKLSKSGIAAGAAGNDDDYRRRAAQIAELKKSREMVLSGRVAPLDEAGRTVEVPRGQVFERGVTAYYTSEDEFIAKATRADGCIMPEPSLGLPGTMLTKSVGCVSCGSSVPAFLTVCPNCSHARNSGSAALRKSRSVHSDGTIRARVRPNVPDDLIIP